VKDRRVRRIARGPRTERRGTISFPTSAGLRSVVTRSGQSGGPSTS
jgi:hypothetical protein